MLVICETHPVPYHAAVYQSLALDWKTPIHVIYGSNFSLRGCIDTEFRAPVAWPEDLLAGYSYEFLDTNDQVGANNYDQVSGSGLMAAVERRSPTALLALGYHHRFDRLAIRAARQLDIPLLFRGETLDSHPERPWLIQMLHDFLLRRLYRSCEFCLPIGTKSFEHYLRLGVPSQRLIKAPYCVDSRPFQISNENHETLRRKNRKALGIKPDQVVLIYSGKLSVRKGVRLLPEAAHSLAVALQSPVTLIFMGSGELEKSLRDAASKSTKVNFIFTGFVSQHSLSGWYHTADLLVLPSLRGETWGLVINDALHHGLPVVASSAVGCVPDLVIPDVTGQICKVGQSDSLADALERCIRMVQQNPALVRTACTSVVENFSVEAASGGIHQALTRLG
jgi:glycosyltransferase involved in cell wall biosynthesis